jgi:heme-degrading monooxygenase HmoA
MVDIVNCNVRHGMNNLPHPPSKSLLRSPLILLIVLMLGLGGCAISTPFPQWEAKPSASNEDAVVLVLTRIVVNTEKREEFDRQTSRVLDSIRSQPGLIGFSARRELFGNQGWTLSAWASDDARAQFVRSTVHQEAIAKSAPAIVSIELKRLTMARNKLPANWTQALALLDDPADRRSYGK